ncbi:serine/threonine protein kinase [Myxococcus stipitatus DSM 14675]|uniref:Serine/threonine protein kinase n=1 Tax=Myxococcus stipitatus (strain DSM 14675 / JCM 12634 / Mx s8) TaxID=1278073 RepID=L7UK87_MYXSD|nr:TonB family protein [Myxococcus stipitatus]AGC48330.1 serine/threonine protein kinase [Myxococcus stipitatus DSM 14675]
MQTESRPSTSPHSLVDPLLGQVLHGRFRVLSPVGAGGMGRVYRALQLPLERVVALKVMSPSFPTASDPEFQRRFLLEASITAKLSHPNTVTVIDYGKTEDGTFYIAMEYLEGRTLAEHLASGPMPWPRAVDIAQQVCRSLREAHRLGVVHRDLKPANVMLLAEEGRDHVKVLDFGLVKSFVVAGESGASQAVPEITQGGMFLGSPMYMAPEQARNLADARSDIYALGVLLYQMLMGRPPFVMQDPLELIFAHQKEPPPRFQTVRPEVVIPEAVEAVVRRCLEKQPAHRYESMEALLEALRGVVGGLADTGPGEVLTGPLAVSTNSGVQGTMVLDISLDESSVVRPEKPRSSLPRWSLMLGVLLVCGAGAYLLGARHAPPPVDAPTVAVPPVPSAAPMREEPPTIVAAVQPPQPVRFHVSSQPSGARVFWKGVERGTTPFVLEVPPDARGLATAELTFVREGYRSDRVLAGGSGEVLLSQRLQRERGGRGGTSSPGAEVASPVEWQSGPSLSAPTPLEVPVAAEPAVVGARPSHVAAEPIQLPENAKPPVELTGNPQPEFPQEARAAGREGMVVLKLVVTARGEVRDVTVMRGEEPFASAALRAVRTWRYQPAMLEGQPVAVYRVVKVPFRLRP